MPPTFSPCPPRAAELAQLAASCQGRFDGDGNVRVTSVTHDSRQVEPGSLFIAIHGNEQDGLAYVPAAIQAGAVGIVAQTPPRTPEEKATAWIEVDNSRKALAEISTEFWGHPDRGLVLTGVTGTNGKTSTAWILESALQNAERPTALFGTLLYRIGDTEEPASHTTPESPTICRLLRQAVDQGCWGAVMEVSSHAIAQERVRGLRYDAAVFTNLEPEHLDFHGTMEAYFETKARFFLENLPSSGLSVLNADDPYSAELERRLKCRVLTYGSSSKADLKIASVGSNLDGLQIRLEGIASMEVRSPLVGKINAWNLAAAAATMLGLGMDEDTIVRALQLVPPVPGRMETVRAGQPYTVLFDYAHTTEALARLLRSVRASGARRILTVFGCGGERDRSKRQPMGTAAAEYSDVVILTTDNPRREDPAQILSDIRKGTDPFGDLVLLVEEDRAKALSMAIRLAQPGDAVVAAGKGEESYQEINGIRESWSERDTLNRLIREAQQERSGA